MTEGTRIPGQLNVKYIKIVAPASAQTAIVAAVAGKKIRVISYLACSSGNVNCRWQSFDGSSTYTDLTGVMVLKGSGDSGFSADYNPDGHFESIAGEALVFDNQHGSNVVGGHMSYIEVQ